MNSTREKAQALIDGIRNAINEGVKHYDKRGRLLATVTDVIRVLAHEGEVEIIPPSFSNVVHIRSLENIRKGVRSKKP